MASLLVQGVACLEAKADNTPEGNKTNSKALGVNAVSGKVTNEQGEALPGVVVRCGNTNVQTDLNGEFHVNVNDGDKLTFTYIGYNTQGVKLMSTGENDIVASMAVMDTSCRGSCRARRP